MEEGVDDITVAKNYKHFEGFKINEVGLHDSNQILRYLSRYQIDVEKCKFYIKQYRKGEPICNCIPETRFTYNPELLILLPKKHFPKVNGIDETIETEGTNILFNDHFVIGFRFTNPFTNEKKVISFYFCPFDIIYKPKIRDVFMGLTATSFAKHRQGVTKYDKDQFRILFHEKEQIKEFYKTNLNELIDEVEKRNKIILFSTSDSIVTLPFLNMYERLRKVIASRRIESELESQMDDNQLYNMRFKNILDGKPLPQWHYKDQFVMDLDYCRSCLRYSE